MKTVNESGRAELIERLTNLEYAIRQSMTVREDQDELANPEHTAEAAQHGIAIELGVSKGDLLNAVQTLVRSIQRGNNS